jgi:hypothetical protein
MNITLQQFKILFGLLQSIREQSDITLNVIKQLVHTDHHFYLPLVPFGKLEHDWVITISNLFNISVVQVENALYEGQNLSDEELYNRMIV